MPPKATGNAGNGPSASEVKKQLVLDWWKAHPEPNVMRVIEVRAANDLSIHKINTKTFKTLTDELVADNVGVLTDKIGAATWFWYSSTESIMKIVNDCQRYATKIDAAKQLVEKDEIEFKQLSKGKENTPQREYLLQQHELLEEEKIILEEEELKYADNDPELIEQLQNKIDLALRATNLWTDNIFLLQRFYLNRNVFETPNEFLKAFQLSENFDVIPIQKRKTPGKDIIVSTTTTTTTTVSETPPSSRTKYIVGGKLGPVGQRQE